jgi:hypothetical protein
MFAAKRRPVILPVNSGDWGRAPIHRTPQTPNIYQMRQACPEQTLRKTRNFFRKPVPTFRIALEGGPHGQA